MHSVRSANVRRYQRLEEWGGGGIGIGLAPDEIDELISLLQMIKSDPEQHFHISSEYQGEGGVGDIEIYVNDDHKPSNMSFFGKALGPGEEV